MIAYVKGVLAVVGQDSIIIDKGGIGININVPVSIISTLPSIGSEVKVFTYTYVREDAIALYGFMTMDDLDVFKLLINVNGVGTKTALSILSAITPNELRLAVISADYKTITKAPGIGKKSAERIVLELRDKVKMVIEDDSYIAVDSGDVAKSDSVNIALEALVSLGFSYGEAAKAVKQVDNYEEMDDESLIKAALKHLS